MKNEKLKPNFILLNTGYAYHNADWNWKNICSPFARIHYVANGTAKIVREDGEFVIKSKHLYLTPPYTKHSYVCDGILELYYIHIYEDIGKNISFFDLIDFPVEIEATDFDIRLIDRLNQINPEIALPYYNPRLYDNSSNLAKNIGRQQKNPLSLEMETQGILKLLISHFVARASYRNEDIENRILKSLYFIHRNLDKPIQIEALAEMCFMTKDHYIRLFKKEMNTTPGKYINQKKIERIQLALLINDKPIKDIAYDYGFDNIFYFNRLFKNMTGMTPGEFKVKNNMVG